MCRANMQDERCLVDQDPLLTNVPQLEGVNQVIDVSDDAWTADELENAERQVEQVLMEEAFIQECFEEMMEEEEDRWFHNTFVLHTPPSSSTFIPVTHIHQSSASVTITDEGHTLQYISHENSMPAYHTNQYSAIEHSTPTQFYQQMASTLGSVSYMPTSSPINVLPVPVMISVPMMTMDQFYNAGLVCHNFTDLSVETKPIPGSLLNPDAPEFVPRGVSR
ncbi:uncharacterized protein LOC128211662 [Mya arenaria]|uniref:uncharacterized protein LOC128211662 n=1 Tax=Mya arenaria TaxID=6604 RepID=UPI0022E4E166|nr:uncharacterized protein LOC128211662 [Mya arenaria]